MFVALKKKRGRDVSRLGWEKNCSELVSADSPSEQGFLDASATARRKQGTQFLRTDALRAGDSYLSAEKGFARRAILPFEREARPRKPEGMIVFGRRRGDKRQCGVCAYAAAGPGRGTEFTRDGGRRMLHRAAPQFPRYHRRAPRPGTKAKNRGVCRRAKRVSCFLRNELRSAGRRAVASRPPPGVFRLRVAVRRIMA